MTETKRIRWEPTKYGGWTGHVGTARDFLFQVWLADTAAGGWQLDSTLPGQFGSGWHRCDSDPDKLKAEAERWLEEFVSSLGAAFPDEPAKPSLAWHVGWTKDSRDHDGNLILRYKPSGGLYRVLPIEET